MPVVRTLWGLLGSFAVLAATSGAIGAPQNAPDQFPLGQSGQTGAVCQAVRNDEDPAAQLRGARSWDVRCRGWEGTLGRLYAYSHKGEPEIGPDGAWAKALALRATCDPAAAATLEGLSKTQRADCKGFSAKVPYVAYSGSGRGKAVAAEGFAQIADVLETGMRVVAGVIAPPKATETLPAASSGGASGSMGLTQAAEAAASAPENLRERGYNRNIAWRFADAETDFRALAVNVDAPAAARAEAYLNWALNTSNTGRFARADALFEQAAKLSSGDQALQGLGLSYQALHLRNQRKFRESIATAQQAEQTLVAAQGQAGSTISAEIQKISNNTLVIPAELASALKPQSSSGGALDRIGRLQVQVAQTQLTRATSHAALGQTELARQQLERARAILSAPRLANVATFLRVEVTSELARQEQALGRAPQSEILLTEALATLRERQAGSPAEAYLTMELAKAQSLSGNKALAMENFRRSMGMFRESRGSLGASADGASAYLDLLLEQTAAEPAKGADYAELFLAAAGSIRGQATAETIAKVSARQGQKDPASAGLVRALEDTRRQVRAKESAIALLQSKNEYPAPVRAASEAELKSLADQAAELEQRVAAADPRYGQLVASDVTLKDLQAKLQPGELYLKVVLLGNGGYGLAVTQTAARPYKIALSQAEGAAAVAVLRRPFETEGRLPAYDVAASYALFQKLFGPVRGDIAAARHIIYEPDSAILSLPIAALATDQASVDLIAARRAEIRQKGEGVLSYNGVHWLGQGARTSLIVSAASFVQARAAPVSRAPRSFIGFGSSIQAAKEDKRAFASVINYAGAGVGDADIDLCEATRTALLALKPLDEAVRELQTVGGSAGANPAIVTGAAFSDSGIQQRQDLNQYKVVYFATHGLLPQAGGCLPEPALLTSLGDASSDGLLNITKILALDLDADLVVLSACDTGGSALAGERDYTGLGGGGEALSGLTQAFLWAGARSLLVSHWRVDSDATVRLMSEMFQSKQPSQGASLQKAMQGFMDSPDQYSHPYYWAAFTVVGDSARLMPS